jgi:hypothetical protein
VLFPLRKNLHLAQKALEPFLPSVSSVDNIEFEYTGSPGITEWLGEPTSGKRGRNRTSIDVAIFWTDKNGTKQLSLVEWKYTERNFGACSVYSSSEQRAKCDQLNLGSEVDPSTICPLSVPRLGNSRRYWEHLDQSGISSRKLSVVLGCPFRTPLYQLMRQCEVASYLRQSHVADFVEVVVAAFAGNHALLEIPPALKILARGPADNIIDIWNGVLSNVSPVRKIKVEQLVQAIDADGSADNDWRKYLWDRYGV